MLSQSDLDAIRSRADGATDGEWRIVEGNSELAIHPDGWCRTIACLAMADEPDATFIAHARTDVPALLDEVHALKHLLMRACGEIFGGVVMRPFMIEELRKHHVVEEDPTP